MRMRDFESIFAMMALWSASDLDQRARRLRAAGLLPHGGRGLNAPQIEAKDGATILISLAAEDAVNASSAVAAYAPLLVSGDLSGSPTTFGEAVTSIMDGTSDTLRDADIRICRNAPYAEIIAEDGRVFRYGAEPAHYVTTWLCLNGGLLRQIKDEFGQSCQSCQSCQSFDGLLAAAKGIRRFPVPFRSAVGNRVRCRECQRIAQGCRQGAFEVT